MNDLDIVIAILILLAAIVLTRSVHRDLAPFRVGGRRYRSTDELGKDVRILLSLEVFAKGPRLGDMVFAGRTGDRVTSVSFTWAFDPWSWRNKKDIVRFRIDIAPEVELDVRDARSAPEPVARAFRELGARRVHAARGRLTIEAPLAAMPLARFADALRLLAELAPALEHPGTVQLGRSGGSLRCAYCHAGGELVACVSCNTLLHEACWSELARCPMLGCRGVSPRVRV